MGSEKTQSSKKRVAIYARVSTAEQDPGMQLADLRAVVRQRGWIIENEYVDHGISGTSEDRPELNKMLTTARSGKVDVVLIWRLDRLGRSLRHVLRILDDLVELNVDFVSLNDNGIDSTSPSGRLLLQLLGAFAEFERNVIVSRVRAGIQRAKDKGVHCGRPVKTVDVRPAVALLREGRSLKETATILNESRTTLRRRLKEAGEWPIRGVQKPVLGEP